MRSNNKLKSIYGSLFAALIVLSPTSNASAAGEHVGGHGHNSGVNIGEAGNKKKVGRVIVVTMFDNRFAPKHINVRKGETVRFLIKNKGEFVHEFNIGTPTMHKQHQKEMTMMMEHGALEPEKINFDRMKMDMGNGKTMMHDDPNSVLLEPGKSAEVIWKFAGSGKLEFACNVPGHYESGMVGDLNIK